MNKILCLATILLPILAADARLWRLTTAEKSFEAEHVSNDGKMVTLKRGSKVVSIPIAHLRAEDISWIAENHPSESTSYKDAIEGAAFDTLNYGDSREVVISKLKKSEMVEGGAADVMMARVGINGTYRTKKTIGGLHCYLYFDWTPADTLKEVTLRSKVVDISSYDGIMKDNWSEMISLLTVLHGKPLQGTPYPNSSELKDGLILCSHLWRTENGDSVLLGTGQEGEHYTVIVRMTSEQVKAARVP